MHPVVLSSGSEISIKPAEKFLQAFVRAFINILLIYCCYFGFIVFCFDKSAEIQIDAYFFKCLILAAQQRQSKNQRHICHARSNGR